MKKTLYLLTLVLPLAAVWFIFPKAVRADFGESCANFTDINPGVIPDTNGSASCSLWGVAVDPEGDRVYYIFDFGQGSNNPGDPAVLRRTVRVPSAAMPCAGVNSDTGTVPSGTECQADHTYTGVGNPHTAFVTAYDEANHESVASSSVPVFITSQVLAANLSGTPATAGWYNYTTFNYTTNCTAEAGFTLNYCRSEVSINNGAWTIMPGGNPNTSGQTIYSYSGTYSFPINGASYRFRSTAEDTGNTPAVFSDIVPLSGQIQIDQSNPAALASSPPDNQSTPFIVSVSLIDYPNPVSGPNSGLSTWDLQYSTNGGVSWSDCRTSIGAGQTSVNFGSGCSPAVTLTPNTTYCFQARARDSTLPTQNQGTYYFDANSMCTPYLVSGAPIAPHTPSPVLNSLVSANNINLQWYGGDPDANESLNYSVYISQPNQGVNVPADLDGQLSNQLPCSSQLPQGCQVTYGAPQNRTPQPGEVYTWLVRVTDGFTTVDSTPIPWSFRVNRQPTVSNVNIVRMADKFCTTPASPANVVNKYAKITWTVSDQDMPAQPLTSLLYYGALGETDTAKSIGAVPANLSNCTQNGASWNCSFCWQAACTPELANQYINVVGYDGLDNSAVANSSVFSLVHTEARSYPASGYDTNVPDGDTRSFNIEDGSILANSSFVRFRGACQTTDEPAVDANAAGNAAVCGGCNLATGDVSTAIPLNDLIAGQVNTLNFSVQGCGFTDYQISYSHVTACDKPYLGVERGSIYSQGNIRAQYSPPAGKYNATYLILGGGTAAQPRQIENFISGPAAYGPSPVDPSFGTLVFPGVTSGGSTRVSSFDYYGLTHNLSGAEVSNDEKNLYGHTVQVFENDRDLSEVVSSTEPLQNKVYWVKGNVRVNQDITFANASDTGSGAGLIIVDSDLNVSSNMYYAPGIGMTARNLASVGWLIRGDVNIDGGVREMVGAYYVEGGLGSGEFRTGNSTQQLTIYGAVIAKRLLLQRTASANDEPSERVVADGRLMLNTPPGFVDIMSTLPAWQFRTPVP